ncbi:hypothetical protein KM043_004064 [Ampulex compressa]|nr:hypothetical protein KM043_004064 [Ampulex compressa]
MEEKPLQSPSQERRASLLVDADDSLEHSRSSTERHHLEHEKVVAEKKNRRSNQKTSRWPASFVVRWSLAVGRGMPKPCVLRSIVIYRKLGVPWPPKCFRMEHEMRTSGPAKVPNGRGFDFGGALTKKRGRCMREKVREACREGRKRRGG